MPDFPRLILISGPVAGLTPGDSFPLAAAETVLGRSPTCAIQVAAPTVSRHHARLTRQGDDFILDDLGSTLGTYVNGVSLGKNTHRLAPGEQIRLGRDAIFEFQV